MLPMAGLRFEIERRQRDERDPPRPRNQVQRWGEMQVAAPRRQFRNSALPAQGRQLAECSWRPLLRQTGYAHAEGDGAPGPDVPAAVEHALLRGAHSLVALQADTELRRPETPAGYHIVRTGKLSPEHRVHAECGEPHVVCRLERAGIPRDIREFGQSHLPQIGNDGAAGPQEPRRAPAVLSTCPEQVTGGLEQRLSVAKEKRAGEGQHSQVFGAVAEDFAQFRGPTSRSVPPVGARQRGPERPDQRRRVRREQTADVLLWCALRSKRRAVAKEPRVQRERIVRRSSLKLLLLPVGEEPRKQQRVQTEPGDAGTVRVRAVKQGGDAIGEIASVFTGLVLRPHVEAVNDLGMEERAEIETGGNVAPLSRLPAVPATELS